jgi:hypothetical protein
MPSHLPRLALYLRCPLLAAVLGVLCGGCATVTPTVAVNVRSDVSCRAFGPVSWSASDTTPTITGIRRHNAAFNRVCPKGKRPKTSNLK